MRVPFLGLFAPVPVTPNEVPPKWVAANRQKNLIKLPLERGWLAMHESGTFVRLTPEAAELFA
jgi:hypothetical protein